MIETILLKILDDKKLRYLIAGLWNTLFGYLLMIGSYAYLNNFLGIVALSMISNTVSISMAFITYKLFVFKTAGNWIKEYVKCYTVYGAIAIINTVYLWVFVEVLSIRIWIAQAVFIPIVVFISYTLHHRVTFEKSLPK